MPWIPIWFEDQQWHDLAARFPSVLAVAQLEQPAVKLQMELPEIYSFDLYYAPRTGALPPPPNPRTLDVSRDEVRERFTTASKEVLQRMIGTTLYLLDRSKEGTEVLLRTPDGRISAMHMSLPGSSETTEVGIDTEGRR